jgi:hypothetical protein
MAGSHRRSQLKYIQLFTACEAMLIAQVLDQWDGDHPRVPAATADTVKFITIFKEMFSHNSKTRQAI